MNDESNSFLREFLSDIRLLDGTSFDHFGEEADMVPMDDVIPKYYIRTD